MNKTSRAFIKCHCKPTVECIGLRDSLASSPILRSFFPFGIYALTAEIGTPTATAPYSPSPCPFPQLGEAETKHKNKKAKQKQDDRGQQQCTKRLAKSSFSQQWRFSSSRLPMLRGRIPGTSQRALPSDVRRVPSSPFHLLPRTANNEVRNVARLDV